MLGGGSFQDNLVAGVFIGLATVLGMAAPITLAVEVSLATCQFGVRWTAVSTASKLEADGIVVEIRLMLDDISELKSVKQELLRSRESLEELSRVGHLGRAEVNPETGPTRFSGEAGRTFDLAGNETLTLEMMIDAACLDEGERLREALELPRIGACRGRPCRPIRVGSRIRYPAETGNRPSTVFSVG